MGDDAAVVQAARVSYGRGTKKLREDRGLIRYLLRHLHTTPFEMCELKLHVKLPIFVARQWIRHRTANVNEYSARYSVLDSEYYEPDISRMGAQSTDNRQGRGDALPESVAKAFRETLRHDAERAFGHYDEMVQGGSGADPGGGDAAQEGLAREVARIGLPLSTYTQWYWKIDLHNLMHFLKLRLDAHAQYEIRAYAEVIAGIMERWVPLCHEAFMDYVVGGARISRMELAALEAIARGERPDLSSLGMSPREQREFTERFGAR
jgi:thymidylate synthase (FAD)